MKHLLAQLHKQHPKPLDGLVLVGCGRLRDIVHPLAHYAKQFIVFDANPNLEGPNQYAIPKDLPCHYSTQVVAAHSGNVAYHSTNMPRFDGLLAPSDLPAPPHNLRLTSTQQRLALGLSECLASLPWPNPSAAAQPGFQWGLLLDVGAAASSLLAALSNTSSAPLPLPNGLVYMGVEHPQNNIQLLPAQLHAVTIRPQTAAKAGFTGQYLHSFVVQPASHVETAQVAQVVQTPPEAPAAAQANTTPNNNAPALQAAPEHTMQPLLAHMAAQHAGYEEQLALKDQQLAQLAQELQHTQEQLQAQEAVNAELTRHQAQSELATSLLRDELTKAQAQIELIKSLMVGDSPL